MKKILILLIALGFLISCEKDPVSNSTDKKILIEKLKNSAIQFNNSNNLRMQNNNIVQENNDYDELMQSSLALIRSYGLTDSEIIQDIGSLYSDDVILGALAVSGVELQASRGIELIDPVDNTSLFSGSPWIAPASKSTSTIQNDVFDCLLIAVGVTAIQQFIQNGISGMSKSAIRKLLKKVSAKYLGAIGAAVAVYEFGDCMEWW
ncbi:MAG: hypothetical protein K9I35_05675 [Flavobacterium sp.]|nr:hypothetical protein [Flavobacterium sp.]